MKLINYYNYIKRKFLNLTKNNETAEDYTQDLYLYHWKNRHKLGKHISIVFVNQLVEHFFIEKYHANRRTKRHGVMVNIDDMSHLHYPAPQEEKVYSQQLYNLVIKLKSRALKKAILYTINNTSIDHKLEKYRRIIKYYKKYLVRLANVY